MSKRKKVIIVISILSSIIVAFIGGQSFSKYMSEVRGDVTTQIATWDFKVNGGIQEVQTIELNTTSNNETLLNNKIAPGTNGSFDITLDSTNSDVGIDYTIKFEEQNSKPKNLLFIYDNEKYYSISELEDVLSGTINSDEQDKTRIFTIKWEWPYETGNSIEEIIANDKIDTIDAQNKSNYSFNIIVSGTQILPQT